MMHLLFLFDCIANIINFLSEPGTQNTGCNSRPGTPCAMSSQRLFGRDLPGALGELRQRNIQCAGIKRARGIFAPVAGIDDRISFRMGFEIGRKIGLVAFASIGKALDDALYIKFVPDPRSEERRVGKECVSTCRSRWS